MSNFGLSVVEGVQPDKWLRVWRQRHREAPVELHWLDTAGQWSALDAGTARVALVRLPEPGAREAASARGFAVELYRERSVVVLPREHPYADEIELSLADIAEFARTPEGESLADTLAVTASGVGVLVLPASLARMHSRKDLVSLPLRDGVEWPVFAAWVHDDELVQDFVGVLRGRGADSSR